MTAIEFENISKQYRLGLVSTRTLSHDLNRWWTVNVLRKEDPYLKIGETNDRATKGQSDYVWALKDINFKVEQGDVVGIIGKNGAGKSTLLKLLSKVTAPTTGHIRARGRIASLLEVGTGFHPEMTGRENIYMNGAILGMTKQEIQSKLDEIVDFSGCERYLDTPVKRYSSGMTVRLGFAIAAHLDPEILVVDEVLAVGDLEFQDKAIGKMKDVSHGEGRTVLFVSHNMSAVKRLCKHGVILKNGMVDYMGEIQECVDRYAATGAYEVVSHKTITEQDRIGLFSKQVEILEATILNECPAEMSLNEPLLLRLKVKRNSADIHQFQIRIIISNMEGIQIAFYRPDPISCPVGKDLFDINIDIPHHDIPKGLYKIKFETGMQDYSKGDYPYDYLKDVLSFNVVYVDKATRSEFLFWEPQWGLRLHTGNSQINVRVE